MFIVQNYKKNLLSSLNCMQKTKKIHIFANESAFLVFALLKSETKR